MSYFCDWLRLIRVRRLWSWLDHCSSYPVFRQTRGMVRIRWGSSSTARDREGTRHLATTPRRAPANWTNWMPDMNWRSASLKVLCQSFAFKFERAHFDRCVTCVVILFPFRKLNCSRRRTARRNCCWNVNNNRRANSLWRQTKQPKNSDRSEIRWRRFATSSMFFFNLSLIDRVYFKVLCLNRNVDWPTLQWLIVWIFRNASIPSSKTSIWSMFSTLIRREISVRLQFSPEDIVL